VADRFLLNGGIMDRFPNAGMRALQRGPVVGIEVSADFTITAPDIAVEDKSWFWLLRHGRRKVPSLGRILMSSAVVNSRSQMIASRAAADS
jgi:NTE family protein